MGANDIQIGGTHYKNRQYEHWDFVDDANLHYLQGCATKYVSRWRDKNGLEDLNKTLHYIQKSQEKGLMPMKRDVESIAINRFANQHPVPESSIIYAISHGNWGTATDKIEKLIEEATNKPEFIRG